MPRGALGRRIGCRAIRVCGRLAARDLSRRALFAIIISRAVNHRFCPAPLVNFIVLLPRLALLLPISHYLHCHFVSICIKTLSSATHSLAPRALDTCCDEFPNAPRPDRIFTLLAQNLQMSTLIFPGV
jgi:hypothetical protein